ncbi:hypothetical protein SVAN01_04492 [Stagonosporopsis vannaccii]|nr:hypothetical protein SVAN01_04492 [Stagonosporopsis vannaccii]
MPAEALLQLILAKIGLKLRPYCGR